MAQAAHAEHLVALGEAHAAHAGATAKILLAYAEADEIERILQGPLLRYNDRTVVDPGMLRTQLKQIRDQGYAVSDGEVDEGVRGISAPVFKADGRITAGLSVVGPTYRLDDASIPAMVRLVREGAEAVTRKLRELDG